jgi:hypothetical protein
MIKKVKEKATHQNGCKTSSNDISHMKSKKSFSRIYFNISEYEYHNSINQWMKKVNLTVWIDY